MSERTYRVRVGYRVARVEGGTKHYEPIFAEATREEAIRYAAGYADWRSSSDPQSTALEKYAGWWL